VDLLTKGVENAIDEWMSNKQYKVTKQTIESYSRRGYVFGVRFETKLHKLFSSPANL